MNGKHSTQSPRRALALLFALCLCVSLVPAPALAASDAVGTTLRLVEHSGTVTVKNASGKAVSVRDEMRLYNGYSVETGAKSSASVSLDGTKAVKLDSSGKCEVKKTGKQLEVALVKGSLFFSVDSPLKTDETFTVRTSTMTTGIRGSFGWINPREANLLHGHAVVVCTNPVTGETRTTELTSGEAVRYEPETAAVADPSLREINFDKRAIENEDVPAVAREELAADPVKQEQLAQDVPALDAEALAESAEEKRAEEDAAAEKEQLGADAALAAQAEELAKRETDYVAFAGEEQPVTIGVPTGLTSYTIDEGDGGGYSNPEPAAYTITVNNDPAYAGTVTANKTTAKAGETVTLTAAPDNTSAAPKLVSRFDGVTATRTGALTYTFSMPARDVTATPVWAVAYSAYNRVSTAYATASSPLMENDVILATAGERISMTVTAIANAGFAVGGLIVSALPAGTDITNTVSPGRSGNTYSFTMPAQDVDWSVQLLQKHTVTIAGNITGGTVTASPTTAALGETVTVTVTPDANYTLDTLTYTEQAGGNNPPVAITATGGKYTFAMIDNDVTINATFGRLAGAFTVTGGAYGTDYEYDGTNHVLNIKEGTPLTIKNTNAAATSDRIVINSGTFAASITLAGVNIVTGAGAALEIMNNHTNTTTITLSGNNTLDSTGTIGRAGLEKNGGSNGNMTGMLILDGTGKLTARGGSAAAGIGGGSSESTYNIIIDNGTIIATGGSQAAGIGGGSGGSGEGITINGGTVTATGVTAAAGIGGGMNGRAADITITGGTVTATGGDNATGGGAGIGGGAHSVNGTGGYAEGITISGGTVTAIGGGNATDGTNGHGGAGIGGGARAEASGITISGGKVKSTGGNGVQSGGAAIGGGGAAYHSVCNVDDIKIFDATILSAKADPQVCGIYQFYTAENGDPANYNSTTLNSGSGEKWSYNEASGKWTNDSNATNWVELHPGNDLAQSPTYAPVIGYGADPV